MKTFKTHFLFLLAICLILTACRTSRQVVKKSESITNQVTESKVTYKDTILYTPKTEASMKIPLSEFTLIQPGILQPGFKADLKAFEKPKIWTQKNGNAKATLKIVHDSVFIQAECDSLALEAKIRQEYMNRYLENTQINDQLIEKQTQLNWMAIIACVIIAFIAGLVTKSLIKISF
ncbi:hypothetical protein [Chryseobacterium sp. KCF3-3]|uniref:hypothetical protein n=1 Tax=Chryseobacterium sp. KCF3-3 TaxID=3231511 RepID=UPI0038B37AD5